MCSTKEKNTIVDNVLENAKDNMPNIFEDQDVKIKLKSDHGKLTMMISKIIHT